MSEARKDEPLAGLDTIGWYIATTHQLVGHDKVAAVLGQMPGDAGLCVICAFENDPTPENRQAVITALQPTPEWRERQRSH